jgi:glycosyl transferase family 87
MENLNYRRIFAIAGSVSLLLYYCFSWINMIADPYERTGSDFMGFYSYGRISQTKGVQYIYNIDEQKKLQEQIVGHAVTPIFYTHLPFIAPLAAALVDEDYVDSFKRWAVVLLLLNALNVYLLINMLGISRFSRENLIFLCMGAYLFDPTFSGLMNGQDTAILLLGAIIWASGVLSKKYFLAGMGLSLTLVRPQIALFLAIPFFFQHRKVFWGFVIGSSILAAISLVIIKSDGALRFVESIRYIESTVWYEAHALDMPTISGIIRRNFTISNPMPIKNLVWICYVLGIVGFCLMWHKNSEINERHVGLVSTGCIFLLPYAHYHDLILLLVPIFCILRIYQKEDTIHQNNLAIAPLAVSWLLTLGFAGSGLLKFPIVYLIMFSLVCLFVTAGKRLSGISSPVSQ